MSSQGKMETFKYDNKIVSMFAVMTMIWGIVGMLVGVIIASQLYAPELNLGLPYTTFGRLRPLHTNAIIFAFVGNGIFTGIYYSLQRLCKSRMFSDALSRLHFWSWQLIIVLAALTLPLGITSGKEYAELEWPIDILITLVWVVFGVNMLGTLAVRRERHMYVAIWFYIASWFAVAVLHIFNSFELPVHLLKSYSAYSGAQDAMVQWWYGHNAVAFFLTTPYLGVMYYFMPKAAGRPVYSYKLSIIHFWALIFIYMWAGPHHLIYTALPDWTQSLGTVFSIMLIAPSWGGMLNGLLTLRGVWDRVREEPMLKFMVVAVTAYGMATFEGPMMALKSVNALSHYTDWTIAHVHVGGLGWNGFLTFGMLYWLIPKIYNTELYSKKAANVHFWVSTLGLIFYAVSMYWSGLAQGFMWKEFTPEGTLAYPNFLETVLQIRPMFLIRAIGGLLYLAGTIVGVVCLFKTMAQGTLEADEEAQAPALDPTSNAGTGHRLLESKSFIFSILTVVALLVGGAFEILPLILDKSNTPKIASVQPYTPLELEGRDIYIREGCSLCHSQMIRPFRSETERYGEYSKIGEYVYEHPFLWGSKRTGPDLHRIGGRYPNTWHFNHMKDPRSTSPGSIMPPYPWLLSTKLDTTYTVGKLEAMQTLGVPYTADDISNANSALAKQAQEITDDLNAANMGAQADSEIVALIAYLQRVGTDIKKATVSAK